MKPKIERISLDNGKTWFWGVYQGPFIRGTFQLHKDARKLAKKLRDAMRLPL